MANATPSRKPTSNTMFTTPASRWRRPQRVISCSSQAATPPCCSAVGSLAFVVKARPAVSIYVPVHCLLRRCLHLNAVTFKLMDA